MNINRFNIFIKLNIIIIEFKTKNIFLIRNCLLKYNILNLIFIIYNLLRFNPFK